MKYLILLLVVGFFLFGCTQTSPQQIYVCPDGNKVLNPDDCKYHQIANTTPSAQMTSTPLSNGVNAPPVNWSIDLQKAPVDEMIAYCEDLTLESAKQNCYPKSLGSVHPSNAFECESLQKVNIQQLKNSCFMMISSIKASVNETFPCERIQNVDGKEYCLISLAFYRGGDDYCYQIRDQTKAQIDPFSGMQLKDVCYYLLALRSGSQYCSNIGNETLKQTCLNGPTKYHKIAVVGTPSDGVKKILQGNEAKASNLFFANTLRPEYLVAGYIEPLKNFDVVILQGQPICDRSVRRVITEYVKNGGRLIVIGDACTRLSDDPSAFGWDIGVGLLGDIVPANIGGATHQLEPIRRGCASGKFVFADASNPIVAGITDFQLSGSYIEVSPKSFGNIVANIECSGSLQSSPITTPAIVGSSSLIGGKTIYLSYDPGLAPDKLLVNTINYLIK